MIKEIYRIKNFRRTVVTESMTATIIVTFKGIGGQDGICGF